MRGLRARHDRARGTFDYVPGTVMHALTDTERHMQLLQSMLPVYVKERLQAAQKKVEKKLAKVTAAEISNIATIWMDAAVVQDPVAHVTALIGDEGAVPGPILLDLGPALALSIGDEWRQGQSVDAVHLKNLLESYGLPSEDYSDALESMLLSVLAVVSSIARWQQSNQRKADLQLWVALLTELCERFPLDDTDKKPLNPRGPAHFPVALPGRIISLAEELDIHPRDIEEHFVRGRGHGGQKINKTSSCVELHHEPSGIDVRVQRFREQGRNRIAAYTLLIEKIEEQAKGAESKRAREIFKARKQKARRSRKAKEKMLKAKKIRGDVKRARRTVSE